MKVLWLSNCTLSNHTSTKSGSWLFAMRDIISHDVNLINITDDLTVDKITHKSLEHFEEYIFPHYTLYNGIPRKEDILEILNIINQISPDIIHIWGTEHYWALLQSRGYLQKWKVVLEIQGLMFSCRNVLQAGLNSIEIKRCRSLKDFIKPQSSIRGHHTLFLRAAKYEREILANCKFISTQSNWTRNQIALLTQEDAKIYKTLLPIREEFILSKKWGLDIDSKRLTIFTSTAYSATFKGLHILIKALKMLKLRYPNCLLKIAGPDLYKRPNWKLSGYEHFLLQMINEYDLINNIQFVGLLDASQIIDCLLHTNVYINSSFVESYSASTAEALLLGVPSVLAYSGAMPDFSDELPVCLYYSPMDYIACAMQIDRLFREESTRNQLTRNAIETISKKCDIENIRQTQLYIYDNIIKSPHY